MTSKTNKQKNASNANKDGRLVMDDRSYFTRYRLARSEGNLRYTPDTNSILRVKSLEESLNSCKEQNQLRNVRVPRSSRSSRCLRTIQSDRTLDTTRSDDCEDITAPTETASKPRVTFSQTHTRHYRIECGDNPALSGRGPAINLSWHYETIPSVSVDEYEATRPENPPKMQDLKLGLVERERLLMESGASRQEMNDFARRVKKAKAKRLETMENLKVYGKAHMEKAERRMEKREKMSRNVLQMFNFRRTETEEQVELWKKASKYSSMAAR